MNNKEKNRILIFNGYYHPAKNYGGPITSIENTVSTCSDEFDYYIVCYNHDFRSREPFQVEINQWGQIGRAQVLYVPHGFLDFSYNRMRSLLLSVNPSIIWFSGVLTPNYKIVATRCARKLKIPVLFSPRGEVSADRVRLKSYKKIPYLKLIRLFRLYKDCYFHATSVDEEIGLIKYFNPLKNHLFNVSNISLPLQVLEEGYVKEKDVLKVIFFSRVHEVKNLLFAIQCVSKCTKAIIFDIYGPIESESYWNECLSAISDAPKNVVITYRGVLSSSSKRKVIQQHDCFLFPTINENYGHVIAESLANSRPVILSKYTTPWDDLNNRAGYAIPLSEPDLFTTKLDYLASLDDAEFKKLISHTKEYFIEKIGTDDAVAGHKEMFREIIDI